MKNVYIFFLLFKVTKPVKHIIKIIKKILEIYKSTNVVNITVNKIIYKSKKYLKMKILDLQIKV